jgi:hypothetical protein
MDPRRVTRVDAILDNHLGRLLDGCFEPHSVESRFGHVRNLWWVGSDESFGANPQEAILILLVKVNLEHICTVSNPRLAQSILSVFPAVIGTLYRTVLEHLAF